MLFKALSAAVYGIDAYLVEVEVDVSLPRFQITAECKLIEPFKALGMCRAFTFAADFSGLNGKTNLYIAEVEHKAVVRAMEWISEAGHARVKEIAAEDAKRGKDANPR